MTSQEMILLGEKNDVTGVWGGGMTLRDGRGGGGCPGSGKLHSQGCVETYVAVTTSREVNGCRAWFATAEHSLPPPSTVRRRSPPLPPSAIRCRSPSSSSNTVSTAHCVYHVYLLLILSLMCCYPLLACRIFYLFILLYYIIILLYYFIIFYFIIQTAQ